jgi:hypothetical protein
MQSDRALNYYFVGKGATLSVDPESADIIRNMVHMDHLVGTLLKEKFGNTGRTQPYLASDWNTSSDGLTWDFHLKPGIKCEDGTLIDAPAFVKSFNRILKLFANRNDLAAFNRLSGWEKFKASSDGRLEGIQAPSGNHLQFLFDSPPDGFSEFLTMPFYGFYCDANFDKDGKWKDSKKIVSSGSYRLEAGSLKDDKIILRRREDFPLVTDDSPDTVTLSSIEASEALKLPNRRTVLYYRQTEAVGRPEGFTLFEGAPIFLTALALSPHRKTVFDNVENRKAFRERVLAVMKEIPVPTATKLFLGNRFYISDQSQEPAHILESGMKTAFKPGEPLKVLRFNQSSILGKYSEEVVIRALKELNWPFELIDPDFKNPDFIKKRNTNLEYDIRFATVDIGGRPENWVINMMFCSELAISFPDASGKICQLVKKHEGQSEKYNTAEYAEQFEKIVAEDAAVIPLFHTGGYWLGSPDIELDKILEPSLVVPRFDQLRFK